MPAALTSQLRRWYPVALVFLTVGLSASMSYPFLALFLTTAVRADPVRVAVFLVAAPLASVVAAQLIGRLSDRRAVRRRLLLLAAGAGVVTMVVNAFVRDYWVLLGVAVTLSAVAASMMSQGFAYARAVLTSTDESARAARTTSALRMLFSLAWVGGPPLAALIQSTAGFSALYLTAAGMYGVAAIVTLARLPEPPSLVHSGETAAPSAAPAGPDAPVRTVAGTIAAFVLLQGAGSVGVQMLALYLARDLHAGTGQAGLMLGLCAGLEIPLMLMFGALSTRIPVHRIIMIGPAFSVAYLMLAATATHSWVLFVGQLLNATAIAAVQGLGVSYVQDLMPRHPGRASALYANSFAAGSILGGPLIAGAQQFGYRTAYVIAAGICAVGFVLIAMSRPPRAAPPGPVVVGPAPA